MKNTLTIALVLLCLGLAVSGQNVVPSARELSYTIDFVFSGKIQDKGDSLFFLRYTFSAADAGLLSELELKDSGKGHSLSFNKTGQQGDMEVKKEAERVRVLVYKYDKFDLPVPTLGQDKQGVKHPLNLKTSMGKLLTSEQFMAQVKGIREMEKQRREAVYNYQPRNKSKN